MHVQHNDNNKYAAYLRGLTVGRCATIEGKNATPWLVAGRSGDTFHLTNLEEERYEIAKANKRDVTLLTTKGVSCISCKYAGKSLCRLA